ncbi:hypothetical protein HK103_005611 [Boothiomyces macroporosus]|uniref:Uncharacterized protein n=1 Tax=Boothiomyces macroporosus TaxID=261099 RepID=A0AAD5Y375_9FUNG|nr:hypothetical protein HK103_005611 [Boothiomyces macroporosus]
MTDRQPGAYRTIGGLLIGLGIHNILCAIFVLAQKSQRGAQSAIWYLSLFASVSVVAFLSVQVMMLDFMTSPYAAPDWYIGLLLMLNWAFHFLSGVSISIILLSRLRIFYNGYTVMIKSMTLLLVLVILVKGVSNGLGVYCTYGVFSNQYLQYEDHPLFSLAESLAAGAGVVEGVFSIVGSISFLNALFTSFIDKSTFVKGVLVKHEGYRLMIILILHTLTSVLLLYNAISYQSQYSLLAFYIPSWNYGLEVYTFLEMTYHSAKNIILDQQATAQQKSRSHSKSA